MIEINGRRRRIRSLLQQRKLAGEPPHGDAVAYRSGQCRATLGATRSGDPRMALPQPAPAGPQRRATYQDVLDAPMHMVAEVVDRTLHTHPRPAMPHALASSSNGGELSVTFHKGRGGIGGWWIVFDAGVAPRRGYPGARPCRLAARTDARLSRDGFCYPGKRLGLRGAIEFDPRSRPPRQAPGLCTGGRWQPLVYRPGIARPGSDSNCATANGCSWPRQRNDDPVSIPTIEAISFPLDALWP